VVHGQFSAPKSATAPTATPFLTILKRQKTTDLTQIFCTFEDKVLKHKFNAKEIDKSNLTIMGVTF